MPVFSYHMHQQTSPRQAQPPVQYRQPPPQQQVQPPVIVDVSHLNPVTHPHLPQAWQNTSILPKKLERI